MNWYDIVHLDRQFVVTGVYDGGSDTTTWTLPMEEESVDAIVLGPDFGNDAGDILEPDTVVDDEVELEGDWSAGEVVIGRNYAMSIELSPQYVRDQQGNADVDAWVTYRQITTAHHNTGTYTIRATMPRRTDRVKTFDHDPIEKRGFTKAWFNGNSKDMRIFIENATPKPCTITSVEFIVDYEPRRG